MLTRGKAVTGKTAQTRDSRKTTQKKVKEKSALIQKKKILTAEGHLRRR